MIDANREQLRQQFLSLHNLNPAQLQALPQDASFRHYHRVHHAHRPMLLMDAPPQHENVSAFVRISRQLTQLGLRAPEIIACDQSQGFVLLEDFGDNTFTRLLADGANETALYRSAIKVLIKLHQHPQAINIDLPPYDCKELTREALLFCDWYLAANPQSRITATARDEYVQAWETTFNQLKPLNSSLVLRDFHIDNLMLVPDGDGKNECGLLDFQDAVIGPSAYDVVSLLEDARRDIPDPLKASILSHYLDSMAFESATNFQYWYDVLGTQRHCKVLGIFTRLAVRDNKRQYLHHLPRVARMLNSHIEKPHLQPIAHWLTRWAPHWTNI